MITIYDIVTTLFDLHYKDSQLKYEDWRNMSISCKLLNAYLSDKIPQPNFDKQALKAIVSFVFENSEQFKATQFRDMDWYGPVNLLLETLDRNLHSFLNDKTAELYMAKFLTKGFNSTNLFDRCKEKEDDSFFNNSIKKWQDRQQALLIYTKPGIDRQLEYIHDLIRNETFSVSDLRTMMTELEQMLKVCYGEIRYKSMLSKYINMNMTPENLTPLEFLYPFKDEEVYHVLKEYGAKETSRTCYSPLLFNYVHPAYMAALSAGKKQAKNLSDWVDDTMDIDFESNPISRR
jgi:hypothetical protein